MPSTSRSPAYDAASVRADFNDPRAVVHYARAAHQLGLWRSERVMIERAWPDRSARLLEAGCGAGRVTFGLWTLGYRGIVAFDFAEEMVDQAQFLRSERQAHDVVLLHGDATAPVFRDLLAAQFAPPGGFDGALFMFNGLMQIPGRDNRRAALRQLASLCRPGAPLLFTTHDRDDSPRERAIFRAEEKRWAEGTQDPRLLDFGDRWFEDETGRTFMHLPDRAEILADLAATGWEHREDHMRRELAKETREVISFSDECRFWLAARAG